MSLFPEFPATASGHRHPSVETASPTGFSVKPYTSGFKKQWDGFVHEAKNATFLFYRDYMDYHHDRFTDHSLMVFDGNELVGLLPANLAADGSLVSHEGLTYGGLVVAREAKLKCVLGNFHAILGRLHGEGISRFIYKQIPRFYNTLPDGDVAYALFLLEASLFRRDCGMTVSESDPLPFRRSRNGLIKKAATTGVRIVREASFRPFWERVLVPQLAARHGAKPVHTLEEITRLAERFPQNIKQFSAYRGDEIVAGSTIYETPTVAHAQYAAVTEEGRKAGALAHLFGWLIAEYKNKRFFDFGTSNENGGRALNHGLLDWKEGFGARCYTHDFFEIATANYTKLEPLLQGRLEIITAAPVNVRRDGFIHPQAIIDDGAAIGKHTRVWAFAHIVNDATVGDDCNICDHTFIEGGVRVGDRVTVKCGVFLWDGLTVENDVFIGPGAVFTNDLRPRSKKYLPRPGRTLLRQGCSLGAQCTILSGLTIGHWAMIGAGAVVTRDVPDFALMVGSPARLRGWVCQCGKKLVRAHNNLLTCGCGRTYEQISETEIKEINGHFPVIHELNSRDPRETEKMQAT